MARKRKNNKTAESALQEDFDCCSRYRECSDAKKCVIAGDDYSNFCAYKRKLDQGIIYYGKNSKDFDRVEYERLVSKFQKMDDESVRVLHSLLAYFIGRGYTSGVFINMPIFHRLAYDGFIYIEYDEQKRIDYFKPIINKRRTTSNTTYEDLLILSEPKGKSSTLYEFYMDCCQGLPYTPLELPLRLDKRFYAKDFGWIKQLEDVGAIIKPIFGRCLIKRRWPEWSYAVHNYKEQIARQEKAATEPFVLLDIGFDPDEPRKARFSTNSDLPYYETTLKDCTCQDFIERERPCKHMYRLAMKFGLIEIIEQAE